MVERAYLFKSLQIVSIMLPCRLMFKLNFLLKLHKLCSLVILSDVKCINFLTYLLKLSLSLKLWFFMSLFIPLNLLILHLILILIFFFYSGSTFIAAYLSSLIGVNVALPTITHFSCVSYLVIFVTVIVLYVYLFLVPFSSLISSSQLYMALF